MNAHRSEPQVSVVIVTWQSRHLIDRCLKPFVDHSEWLEVIVYDNASSDGTAEHVAHAYPWATLIVGRENIGFGRANNAALGRCRGEFVLMLNPDAYLDDLEPVRRLVTTLGEHPDAAAVGPQLVHENGQHQVGDAGWTTNLLSMAGHVFWLHRISTLFPSIYLSNPSLLHRDHVDVDWICGACLMARRSILEALNGFSEEIFLYGEDVELGDRIRWAGFRLLYLPRVVVLHVQGSTQKGQEEKHYSARWLDARAKRFAGARSKPAYLMFKLIAAGGFGLRGLTLELWGIVARGVRPQAKIMRRYAKHAASLPSYEFQRGLRR